MFHRVVLLALKNSRMSLQLSSKLMWRYVYPEENVDIRVITSTHTFVDVTFLYGKFHRALYPAINRKFYEICGVHIQRVCLCVCVCVCVCVCDFAIAPRGPHQYETYLLYIRATNGIYQNLQLKYQRPLSQRSLILQIYFHLHINAEYYVLLPVEEAARSNVLVCGRLPAEIVGSNPAGGMDICCKCCMLSGGGLCDELITRPAESYRLWCVDVCDLETSRMRRP